MTHSSTDAANVGPELKILKGSEMPSRCILCGGESEKSFSFEFRKETFGSVLGKILFVFAPFYGWLMSSESIVKWSKLLPLCPDHWSQADHARRLNQSFAGLQIGAIVIAVFVVGSSPPLALAIVVPTLLVATVLKRKIPKPPVALVQQDFVVLRSVPPGFREAFEKANDGSDWAANMGLAPGDSSGVAPDNPFGTESTWRT